MKRNRKLLLLWALLVFAVLLTIIWEVVPLPDASRRLAAIPEHGPGFASRELPLSDLERDSLGKATALKRLVISDPGVPIILSIIDGTHNRHAVHDPVYCFVGEGWNIVEEKDIEIPSGHARYLLLERNGENCEAVYWFDDNDRRFTDPTDYWMQATLRRLSFGQSGEEPILVLMRSIPGQATNWQNLPYLINHLNLN
ncbi:exosortase-associated EpsI family protein [Rubellicoccus peritrichatus]|uniref:Exosortase-associated EpsI family protein n=1 Tax=Rubellicoccus peritrichatus TaxID=3080537 RepID=A0AAQ3LDR4_9BACT|nr:exosortase-associated EpsI family protein [Puniceicoccus sp. CR14]WOO42025.1 exosortase-associated EpsI family protein [Puniceicoccus sp. CR14]